MLYEGWDRQGLIYHLTGTLLSAGDINIRAFDATVPEQHLARIRFSFEAPDQETIERARQALSLLQKGEPILDTAYLLGYFDQPHLTRSLKLYAGKTPAQILQTQNDVVFLQDEISS